MLPRVATPLTVTSASTGMCLIRIRYGRRQVMPARYAGRRRSSNGTGGHRSPARVRVRVYHSGLDFRAAMNWRARFTSSSPASWKVYSVLPPFVFPLFSRPSR